MKKIVLIVVAGMLLFLLTGCFGAAETEEIVFSTYESSMLSDAFAGTLHAENESLSNGYVISSQKLEVPTTVTLDYAIASDGGNLYIIYVTPRNNERILAKLEDCTEGSSSDGHVIITMPKGQNTIGVVGQKAVNCSVEVSIASEPTPAEEE